MDVVQERQGGCQGGHSGHLGEGSLVGPDRQSVFRTSEFRGSEICNGIGDPTGKYNKVIRYDSGVFIGLKNIDQYLRERFDLDLIVVLRDASARDHVPSPQRPISLDDDGSFSHRRMYRKGDLEITVATWGAREYRADADGPSIYNISVELHGPEGAVAVQRRHLDLLLRGISSVYKLHPAYRQERREAA